ncbi:hypothetical protein BC831DRAFT_476583 [Entophlyctis helioformis]|nr:hypothetical protein BC831DRAFT_476583 [Entophlyctis helioformis]
MPEHAADVFIPFHHTRPHLSGNQSIKDTVLVPEKLEGIRELAFHDPDDDIHVILRKQREQLHTLSQERVKSWGNTIMGSRKKRLAAQDVKARMQEEERKRVDAEWAVVRATERQEAIQRARLLQRFEEPRLKALHSQLLMSNVLYERDKQIETKKQRNMANEIRHKSDVLKMRLALLDSIEKDKQDQERRRLERFQFADSLRCEIRKKAQERQAQRNLDLQYYRKLFNDIEVEEKEKVVRSYDAKKKSAKECRETLAVMISEKQERKMVEKKMAKELEVENRKFNERKEYQVVRKTEYDRAVAEDREKVHEGVGKIALELDKEAEKAVLAYIEKTSHARDHVYAVRMAAEQAKHDKQLAEQREFLTEHSRIKQQRKNDIRAEAKRDRQVLIGKAEQWELETIEQDAKQKKVLLALREYHEQQITASKAAAKVSADLKHQAELQMRKAADTENAEFDAYAATTISQWAAEGKNVAPILSSLEKERPGYVRRRRGDMKREVNSFERLGFSVRWMPGTSVRSSEEYAAVTEKARVAARS